MVQNALHQQHNNNGSRRQLNQRGNDVILGPGNGPEGQPPSYVEPLIEMVRPSPPLVAPPHQNNNNNNDENHIDGDQIVMQHQVAVVGGGGGGGAWLLPQYGLDNKNGARLHATAGPSTSSVPTPIIPMGAQVTGTFAQIPGPQYHAQIANNSTIIASSLHLPPPIERSIPPIVNSNNNNGANGPIAITAPSASLVSPLHDNIPMARLHPQEEHPFSVSPRDDNDGVPHATALLVSASPAVIPDMHIPMASLVVQQPQQQQQQNQQRRSVADRSSIVAVSGGNPGSGIEDDIPFAISASVPSSNDILPPPYDAALGSGVNFPSSSHDFISVEKV
jgi:hypothetical protein